MIEPVKCGCGGEAKVDKHTYYRALPTYGVRCHRCGQQTRQFYMNEAEAITAWNKAIGERTAKVTNIHEEYSLEGICFITYGICGNCGAQSQKGDNFCYECGARLEWE